MSMMIDAEVSKSLVAVFAQATAWVAKATAVDRAAADGWDLVRASDPADGYLYHGGFGSVLTGDVESCGCST